MSVGEKMQAYIEKTKLGDINLYSLTVEELQFAYQMVSANKLFDLICLIFEYGMAKGYRKAQKDMVKHERNRSQRGT